MVAPASNALNRLLAPLADCLNAESADRIAHFQIDPVTQARINELADKSNRGELTESERSEYLEFVEAFDLVGILKGKAREVLALQGR